MYIHVTVVLHFADRILMAQLQYKYMYHIVQNHGKSTVKSSTTGKGDIIMIIHAMILICSCYIKKSNKKNKKMKLMDYA